MQKFSKFDPLFSIFQIKPIRYPQKLTSNKIVLSIVERYPIPNNFYKLIDQLSQCLQNGLTRADALTTAGFTYPFYLQTFETFLNLENLTQQEIELISQHILVGFVSWTIYCERTQNLECFLLILKAILLTVKSSYHQIAIEAFLYSIGMYDYYQDYSNLVDVFDLVLEFFQIPYELPPVSYSMIPLLINEITHDIKNGKEQDVDVIFPRVIKILDNFSSLPPGVSDELIFSLSPFLSELNLNALDLFSHVFRFSDINFIQEMFGICASVVFERSLSEKMPIKIEKNSVIHDKILIPENIFPKYMISNIEFKKLGFDLNIEKNSTIPVSYIVGSELTEIIDAIVNSFVNDHRIASSFLSSFLDFLNKSINNQRILNVYATLFYLCDKIIEKGFKIPPIGKSIFTLALFDQNISLNQSIEELHSKAFNIIINEDADSICYMLEKALPYPYLFGECAIRCALQKDKIKEFFQQSPKIIEIFRRSILCYQNEEFRGDFEIEIARIRVFQALNTFFNDNDLAYAFSVYSFSRAFMSLIFESNLYSFVSKNISHFSTKTIEDAYLIIFESLYEYFPEDKYILIIIELIEMVLQTELTLFSVIISPLIRFLSKLEKTKLCEEFLIKCISILPKISKTINFKNDHALIIGQSCFIIYDMIPFSFFDMIVDLMRCDNEISLPNNFLVHHSNAAKLLILLYQNSDECISKVFSLLNSLIDYTPYNALQFHECGLDNFLISLYIENKIQREMYLKLFLRIVSIACSSEVVEKTARMFGKGDKTFILILKKLIELEKDEYHVFNIRNGFTIFFNDFTEYNCLFKLIKDEDGELCLVKNSYNQKIKINANNFAVKYSKTKNKLHFITKENNEAIEIEPFNTDIIYYNSICYLPKISNEKIIKMLDKPIDLQSFIDILSENLNILFHLLSSKYDEVYDIYAQLINLQKKEAFDFKSLAYYLIDNELNSLNYQLYLNFFKIYEEILPIYQPSFFKDVVFNFDIWFSCKNDEDLFNIIKHWCSNWHTKFKSKDIKLCAFKNIVKCHFS